MRMRMRMRMKMKMKMKTDQVSRLSQAVLQQSLHSGANSLGQGRIPKGQGFSPELGIWVAQHDQQGWSQHSMHSRAQLPCTTQDLKVLLAAV